ncbi:MAG: hypothetical protein HKN33_00900, partial [Pyrinomonadaceae bacterium]|nr:hypothetical protein [Pyrinomonadaceae bacterium]
MDGAMSIDACKVQHYDQSELIGMHLLVNREMIQNPDEVRRGICQTMSLFWIKTKQNELASSTKHDSEAVVKAIDANFEDIATLHEVKDHERYGFNIFGPAENYFDLTKTQTWQDIGTAIDLSVDGVSTIVTGTKNCCYLYAFHCFNDDEELLGGHAIAFYLSSGKMLGLGRHVYVFDPNFGEFKVPKSNFKNWLG